MIPKTVTIVIFLQISIIQGLYFNDWGRMKDLTYKMNLLFSNGCIVIMIPSDVTYEEMEELNKLAATLAKVDEDR